jgi:hypothetical protein
MYRPYRSEEPLGTAARVRKESGFEACLLLLDLMVGAIDKGDIFAAAGDFRRSLNEARPVRFEVLGRPETWYVTREVDAGAEYPVIR